MPRPRNTSRSKASPKAEAPKKAAADPLRDAARGPRLHKVMAEAGLASRRACERYVEEGRVAVNGRTVTSLPVWVDPSQDRIELDGKPVVTGQPTGPTYLMLNKPRRVISTNRDPEGRTRAIDLVPHSHHLFCVGRLDADSTGLLLLTDDGDLAQRLTHPRYQVPKTYRVTIKGALDEEGIEKLRRGIYLADKDGASAAKAHAADVRLLRRDRDRTRLEITLREGRNREIRRMLARLGHRVHRLQRTAIGSLQLKGLASGEWRRLSRHELRALRETAGLLAPRTSDKPTKSKKPRKPFRSKAGTSRQAKARTQPKSKASPKAGSTNKPRSTKQKPGPRTRSGRR